MLNQQSTIFISGASDGIGKAMALEIARRTPCKLALCGRNEEKLKNVLKEKKRVSFFELFPVASKEYIVATFLAILEMAKSRELVIKQEKEFADTIATEQILIPNGGHINSESGYDTFEDIVNYL